MSQNLKIHFEPVSPQFHFRHICTYSKSERSVNVVWMLESTWVSICGICMCVYVSDCVCGVGAYVHLCVGVCVYIRRSWGSWRCTFIWICLCVSVGTFMYTCMWVCVREECMCVNLGEGIQVYKWVHVWGCGMHTFIWASFGSVCECVFTEIFICLYVSIRLCGEVHVCMGMCMWDVHICVCRWIHISVWECAMCVFWRNIYSRFGHVKHWRLSWDNQISGEKLGFGTITDAKRGKYLIEIESSVESSEIQNKVK